MLNIAICDYDYCICEKLENILCEILNPIVKKVEFSVFYTGEKLLKFLYQGNYFDIIFLDVQLGIKNGVEVGKAIRNEMNNETTQIVFISCDVSCAMELFDVRPLNCLIKPLKSQKIEKVVNEALKLIENGNHYFNFCKGRKKYKVPIKDILYFESNKRKVKIIMQEENHDFYGMISAIQKQLINETFLLIHNSYLINYIYIKEYNYHELRMINKIILPISRSHRKLVREKLLQQNKLK